jgi:glycosyltransferase involved in cell wall biosynthesis
MKIAFWNSGFMRGYGGAEVSAAELINALAEQGESCYLLSSKPEPGGTMIRTAHLDEQVEVRLGVFHNPLNFAKNPFVLLYKILRYLGSAGALFAWLVRQRVDVIHQHFIGIDVVMLVFFKRLLGYRLVLTFHGLELELADGNSLSGWKNRLALKHADHITAVSRQQCDQLSRLVPGRRVHYIPNAIDKSGIRSLATQPSDLPIQPGHFVFCGRLNPVKQVPGLVRAFEKAVLQGCSRNLYIMGSGPDDEAVRNLVEKHGLKDRVFMLRGQQRRHALYMIRKSRCLLLNSSSEGYPMVILEAMVLGKPVIAPEVGGIGELLTHGKNALLFPVNDEQALSSAILELDRNDDLVAEMGNKSAAKIADMPGLDIIVGRYMELYVE